MTYEIDDNKYPGTAVVFITATWGRTTYTGSGVIVGRNDVLTAAHVIYDGALGGLADTIKIYASYDPDDRVNPVYDTARIQYFPSFDPDNDGRIISGDLKNGSFQGTEFDISLLTTRQAIGDIHGWFGIDWGFKGGSVGVIAIRAFTART